MNFHLSIAVRQSVSMSADCLCPVRHSSLCHVRIEVAQMQSMSTENICNQERKLRKGKNKKEIGVDCG